MLDSTSITIGGKELDPVRGGLLITVIGLCIAGFGIYDYFQQAEAIENSVEVDATIVEVGVESVSSSGTSGTKHKPDVTFEYNYQGESHTASNVFPATIGKNYDTKSQARSVLEGYEKGKTVTAYTNPDSPGDAFLKNKQSSAPLMTIGIGGVFVLIGGVSVFRGFTR